MIKKIALLIALTTVTSIIAIGVTSNTWFLTAIIVSINVIFLLIIHRLYNLLNWIDPTVMFVVSYTTFISIGTVAANFYNIRLSPSVLLSVIVGIAAFLAGSVISDVLASPLGQINITRSIKIATSYRYRDASWAWVFFLIGAAIILFFYYTAGVIPFLSDNAESVRLTAKAGRGYLLIGGFAFLSVSTVNLVAVNAKKDIFSFTFSAGWALIIAAILLLGVGYRMPAVRLMLNGFIIYSFRRKSKLSRSALLGLIMILVLFLSFAGFYRLSGQVVQSSSQVTFALNRAVYSLFVRYLQVFNMTMPLFPHREPFMFGESYWMSIKTILPGSQLHFGFWLRDRIGLALSTGPVDPTILGEFYVNFGWAGIVLGMFTLGFFLRTLYRYLTRGLTVSIKQFALLILISTSIIGVAASGLILVFLFDTLPIVLVFLAYYFCTKLRFTPYRLDSPTPQRAVLKS